MKHNILRQAALASTAFAALAACNSHVHEAAKGPTNFLPGTCAEAHFAPPAAPAVAVSSTSAGKLTLHLQKGSGTFTIDEVDLEVLSPGAKLFANGTESDPIATNANAPVSSTVETNLPAADRDVTVTFDGKDSAGNALPSGVYPVIFLIKSSPAGACEGTNAEISGQLGSFDWQSQQSP